MQDRRYDYTPPGRNGRGGGFKPLPGFEKHMRQPADVGDLVTSEGLDALSRAVGAGLGILVSLTSDGGALSVTIYDGEQVYRSYAANFEEAIALWKAVDEAADRRKQTTTAKPVKTSR